MNTDSSVDFTDAATGERVTKYLFVMLVLISVVTVVGIVLIPFFALLYWLWYKPRYGDYHSMVLSDRFVNIRKGVVFRNEINVPLDRITDVTVSQGPVMRWAGVYGIKIESAGQTTPEGGANLIVDRDPRDFRQMVMDRAESVKSGQGAVNADARVEGGSSQTELLTEIRDILRRIEHQG